MDHIDLHSIDADGAIAETAAAADEVIAAGDTRLSFLRKGAFAGGAALSGGAILGALIPGAAMAAGSGLPPATIGPLKLGNGDIRILNYALTLEYLESTFYNEATKNNLGKGDAQLQAFLTTATKDENAHVAFLKGALGSKAIPEPKFKFGAATTNAKTFAATAYVIENTGVHAYLGQAPNIKSPAYLLAAASIVTIEARHSGALGLYLGKPIAPTTRDTGLPASTVIKAVTPFVIL